MKHANSKNICILFVPKIHKHLTSLFQLSKVQKHRAIN